MADCLLASNGIISRRQAGKLRFMDSLEAEQERGITMKSSLVALKYTDESNLNNYTINLIDSPGHVDFSSEVSTAVRLCDGALLVVDVIEGVCPQTRTVMRQAWVEGIKLVLVLNKIDRLILELQLDPLQAYEYLQRVIEQVNSVVAELYASENFKNENIVDTNQENSENNIFCWSTTSLEETSHNSSIYFNPTLFSEGVILASAYDNWGFRTCDFAKVWSEKLKLPLNILSKALWGDFYLSNNPRPQPDGPPKIIKKGAGDKGKTPLFVSCILKQIWNVYDVLVTKKEYEKVSKMAENLKVSLNKRELKNCDYRGTLKAFMSAWLPLGESCMKSVIKVCPNPLEAVNFKRAIHILYGENLNIPKAELNSVANTSDQGWTPILKCIQACDSKSDSFVAFVSKVFWFPKFRLVVNCDTTFKPEDEVEAPLTKNNPFESTEFVALTRIFSGSAYSGRKVFVLGPKFDSSRIPKGLFDADPNFLPAGQVYFQKSDISDEEQQEIEPSQPKPLVSSSGLGVNRSTNLPVDIALMSRRKNDSLSDSSHSPGSVGSIGLGNLSISSDRIPIRHLYVAEITSIVKFLAGQQDIKKIDRDKKVGSGQIVGLLGSDLITALPKSGLIISSLRLLEKIKPNESQKSLFTFVNQLGILPLAGLAVNMSPPVISVSIEPAFTTSSEDIQRFERGLRLLERSDPCVEVTVSTKGEYFVHAMGEIHLQKCLDDLTKFFAPNLEIHISPFVVPFRETIIASAPSLPDRIDLSHLTLDNEDYVRRSLEKKRERSHCPIEDSQFVPLPMGFIQVPHCKTKTRVYIHVTAHPMPEKMVSWILKQKKSTFAALIKSSKNMNEKWTQLNRKFKEDLSALLHEIEADRIAESHDEDTVNLPWSQLTNQFVALGPEYNGLNILFSCVKRSNIHLQNSWACPVPPYLQGSYDDYIASANENIKCHSSHSRAIIRGFQTFVSSGPICAEPLQGVIFILKDIFAQEIKYFDEDDSIGNVDVQFELDTDDSCKTQKEKTNVQVETPDGEDVQLEALRAQQREKIKKLALVSWMDEDLDDLDDDWNDVEIMEENTDRFQGHQMKRQRKRRQSLDLSTSSSSSSCCSNSAGKPRIEDQNACGQVNANQILLDGEEKKGPYYYVTLENSDWLSGISPGMLTPAMSRACTIAYQVTPGQRLLLAMYDLQLQARADVLGKMYTELRRRSATIVNEEMREGEHAFIIHAKIPVIESFGLTNDLRKRTSGYISLPQLTFGGWSLLDVDPTEKDSNGDVALSDHHLQIRQTYESALAYANQLAPRLQTSQEDCLVTTSTGTGNVAWKQRPAKEDDDFISDETENNALLIRIRTYIRSVRRRKGLPVYEQIVVHADKQRTLKKNK